MAREFFRTLKNGILGRTHFEEGKLNFEETKNLLGSLASRSCVNGKIVYYHPPGKKLFDKLVHPSKAKEFVSHVFRTVNWPTMEGVFYFEGNYQSYSGKNKDNYYLELSAGVNVNRNLADGKNRIREEHKRAKLEFLIKNS